MIDFPNSPTVGQVVSSPSGTAWRWTGSTWVLGTAASAGGARGAVAYAQITAAQSGIPATVTDIAGLSATWTASPNRTYRTSLFVHVSGTATATTVIYIKDGAGTTKSSANGALIGTTWCVFQAAAVESGLSGSQTRKVSASVGGGGAILQASPTTPAFILVEDITYDAGPGGAAGGYGVTVTTCTVQTAATSTTFVDVPSLAQTVASGNLADQWIATLCADIQTNNPDSMAQVGCFVDGSVVPAYLLAQINGNAAGVQRLTQTKSWVVTNLAPGSHTIGFRLARAAGTGSVWVMADHSQAIVQRVK